MSTKKPRLKLKATNTKAKQEFRNCDAPGCRNVVSIEDKPQGYSGPVYCALHRRGTDA